MYYYNYYKSTYSRINSNRKDMKHLFTFLFLLFVTVAYAQTSTWVNGYITSSGQYVEGHYRTTPNETRNDNYSSRPNINPYTGQVGTKPRDEDVLNKALREQSLQTYPTYSAPSVPAYQNYTAPTYQNYTAPALSQPTYVGPRGGVYHFSPSGKKVYQ